MKTTPANDLVKTIGEYSATEKPALLTAKVWFDGSCEPKNPGGTARGGWIIETNDDKRYVGCKVIAKNSTNNVAEFGALLGALTDLKERDLLGIELEIYGDSRLVVETVSRRWKCKAQHLKPMLIEVWKLLRQSEWTIKWIPREQNKEADEISR